ncbi:hypothetical protein ACFLS9_08470 [Bacteroidota bacterium]
MKTILFLLFIFYTVQFAQDDYKKWLENQKKKLNNFIKEDDKRFVEFLKKDWEKFQLFQGLKPDKTPKPPVMPVYKPPEELPYDPELKPTELEKIKKIPDVPPGLEKKAKEKSDEIEQTENQESELKPVEPAVQEIDPVEIEYLVDPEKNNNHFDVDFYGTSKTMMTETNFQIRSPGKIDKEYIGDFWELMSTKNYKDILIQTQNYNDKLNLNDWGYCMLLNKIGEKIYPSSPDLKHLLIWFLLNKSGYKARVGIIENKVYVFFPSENKIYGVPYFLTNESQEKLYVIDFDNLESSLSGSLFTYNEDYPGADKILDMNIYRAPNIEEDFKTTELSFTYKDIKYKVPVEYNKSLIRFYKDYPYSNLEVYFNSAISNETKNSMISSLKYIIEDKPDPVAVNMLLRFVQTSFGYKTDQPNFGREKPLFREETIHYPYSDCEDRSILFSYLVKNILGLSVIGVDYPGHVATAVKFNLDVPGDYITYKGEKYIICDPTYTNAYIGMSMQKYKNTKPEKIIEIN